MSTQRHTPIPPEIQEAILQKPAKEQERLRQVWQLLGHLDHEDLEGKDLAGKGLNIPDTETALADLENTINAAPPQPSLPPKDRAARRGASSLKSRSLQSRSLHRSLQWTTTTASLFIALFAIMIWYWRVPVVVKAPLV